MKVIQKQKYKFNRGACVSGCERKYGDEGCPSDCNYCGHDCSKY